MQTILQRQIPPWVFLINIRSAPQAAKESNRKEMNRNWSNQKANPALKTKAGNK